MHRTLRASSGWRQSSRSRDASSARMRARRGSILSPPRSPRRTSCNASRSRRLPRASDSFDSALISVLPWWGRLRVGVSPARPIVRQSSSCMRNRRARRRQVWNLSGEGDFTARFRAFSTRRFDAVMARSTMARRTFRHGRAAIVPARARSSCRRSRNRGSSRSASTIRPSLLRVSRARARRHSTAGRGPASERATSQATSASRIADSPAASRPSRASMPGREAPKAFRPSRSRLLRRRSAFRASWTPRWRRRVSASQRSAARHSFAAAAARAAAVRGGVASAMPAYIARFPADGVSSGERRSLSTVLQ